MKYSRCIILHRLTTFTERIMKKLLLLFSVTIITLPQCIQGKRTPSSSHKNITSINTIWAEETLASMTLKEKIGQLFMASAGEDLCGFEKAIDMDAYYRNLIDDCKIGGVIMFYGSPEQQIPFSNKLQNLSKVPLLIGQDSEWGLSMRLKNTITFPKNMTLGAIQDDDLIFQAGKEIGKQSRMVGGTLVFAPVIDINTNPNNPIIGTRSFGSDKKNVAKKGIMFMKGMQSSGVLTCAKHFPGHGDTDTDSHLMLPVINHDMERLNAEELYPFKALINAGVDAIMPAHLAIPALGCPTKSCLLSKTVVHDLLQKRLGFTGLVVTDGMSMKGVSSFFTPQYAALQAILAGNDIILCPPMIKESIDHIAQAVTSGILPETELDKKVLKILRTKEKLCLHKTRMIAEDTRTETINNPSAYALKKLLFQKAITIMHNESQQLPLKKNLGVSFVNINAPLESDGIGYNLALDASNHDVQKIINVLELTKTVVIRCFQADINQSRYGKVSCLAPALKTLLEELAITDKQVIILLATSPYALYHLPKVPTIISYENDPDALKAGMDVLWGNTQAEGRLPIALPGA